MYTGKKAVLCKATKASMNHTSVTVGHVFPQNKCRVLPLKQPFPVSFLGIPRVLLFSMTIPCEVRFSSCISNKQHIAQH